MPGKIFVNYRRDGVKIVGVERRSSSKDLPPSAMPCSPAVPVTGVFGSVFSASAGVPPTL